MNDDVLWKVGGSILFFGILLAALAVSSSAETVHEATIRAAESAGLVDVKPGGHAWFACSDSDMFATEFTAKNATGKPVNGVVCCGILKGCTIRW